MTPVDVLQEAARRGLSLSVNGQKLRVSPAKHLTPGFVETLKAHKWHLLCLLKWPFLMVHSLTLGDTIFFCEDQCTKEALIQAGASAWSIYTKAELQILVEQNRIKPFTDAELKKVHEIKRNFGASSSIE